MSRRSNARTSLACQPCRNQHLRCDAVQPSCSRCRGLSRPCSYPESRRTGNFRAASSIRRATRSISQSLSICAPGQSSPFVDHGTSKSPRSLEASTSTSTSNSPNTRQASRDDTFLGLYYEHFHSSHPFVLPQPALESAINAGYALPSLLHLTTVMRHIGSVYAGTPLDLPLPSDARDGFSIQATLLLSLAHSMCTAQAAADQLLAKAIEQAKHIGMCSDDFAKATQEFDPVLAESWRRTWWMLYVTHLNYAVIRRDYTTNLNGADYDVALPCKEEEYTMMVIPLSRVSIQNYNNQELTLQDSSFSSFAHFINATEVFVSVLRNSFRLDNVLKAKHLVENDEATIAAWYLMLSHDKRRLVHDPGMSGSCRVDHLMFQAHMMMSTCLAYIHRPLSDLHYHVAESISSCGSPPPPLPAGTADILHRRVHLQKLLQAVRTQNQSLIALPLGSLQLSPFTICMIACCTIAHLVAYRSVLAPDDAKVARSRIRVCIGTLTSYATVWPRASKVLRELKSIAGVLLQNSPGSSHLSATPLSLMMGGQQITPLDIQTPELSSAFEKSFGLEDILLADWSQLPPLV